MTLSKWVDKEEEPTAGGWVAVWKEGSQRDDL